MPGWISEINEIGLASFAPGRLTSSLITVPRISAEDHLLHRYTSTLVMARSPPFANGVDVFPLTIRSSRQKELRRSATRPAEPRTHMPFLG